MNPRNSDEFISQAMNGRRRGAGGLSAIMREAFSMTRGGTASSTSPMRLARRASMARPVSIMSSASGGATKRDRRITPPISGQMPSMTSGSDRRVPGWSTAMR